MNAWYLLAGVVALEAAVTVSISPELLVFPALTGCFLAAAYGLAPSRDLRLLFRRISYPHRLTPIVMFVAVLAVSKAWIGVANLASGVLVALLASAFALFALTLHYRIFRHWEYRG
jgi:hypothetical protein